MAARITPLRLEAFEQLPKHARRCVYWEVDPSTLRADDHLSDPEFEKEAWLSMVMLEWGSCGQMAVHCRDGDSTAGDEDAAMPLSAGTIRVWGTPSTHRRVQYRARAFFPAGR